MHSDLEEALAYWNYSQKNYDSAAYHLTKALDNNTTIHEKARWEFLAGQLYALDTMNEESHKYFSRSADHAVDPIMAVYATLNSISVSGGDTTNIAQQKINSLMRLTHRD